MKRWLALLAATTLVLAAVATPAAATKPDVETFSDGWVEDVFTCEDFGLQYDVLADLRLTTFYDSNGDIDRFHEQWHILATLQRDDLTGPELGEQYTTTWIYEPDDFWTPTGHGMQYNTVVPGYGPVFKVNGTFTADFTGWPPLYEATAWNITPFTADPAAFDVLCEYFS